MNREEKTALVDEIAAQIDAADAIFAIDYRGLSVPQAAELRTRLREADASFRVVKNRLTKLAAQKVGRDQLLELLEGPTALTFVGGDVALAARAIWGFHREHSILDFKGGMMEGEALASEEFQAIARLPGREALSAQFVAVVASPLSGLVRGLSSMIAGLAIGLRQIEEKGILSAVPAAEEAAAEPAGETEASQPEADEAGAQPTSEAEPSEPAKSAGEEAEAPEGSQSEPEEAAGAEAEPKESDQASEKEETK